MKLGETQVLSWWLTGTESEAEIAKIKADMMLTRESTAAGLQVIFDPPVWSERKPGEDGVYDIPSPPDRIQGPNVRLLIAESTVKAHKPQSQFIGITGFLTKEQLTRGRAVVKSSAASYGAAWDDMSCDMYLDSIDPKLARRLCGA